MRIFTTHIGLVAFELLMIARALIAASLLSISVVAWAETSLTGSSAVDPLAPLDTDEWTVVQGAPLQLGRDQPPAWVQLLKSIAQGRTMVVIDHDMDALFTLAERVTVLQGGRVLVEGTPEEIKNDARVQDAYLGGVHGTLAGA